MTHFSAAGSKMTPEPITKVNMYETVMQGRSHFPTFKWLDKVITIYWNEPAFWVFSSKETVLTQCIMRTDSIHFTA